MKRNRDNLFNSMVDQETVPSYFQPQPSPMELEARRQAIGQKAQPIYKSTPGDFNFKGTTLIDPNQLQPSVGGVDRFASNSSYANQLSSNISDNSNADSTSLKAPKFDEVTQQDVDAVKQDDLKSNEDSNINVNAAVGALKTLANVIEPKEELPATQYRSFTVDDNSGQVRDVMSARREALMKMMGGR